MDPDLEAEKTEKRLRRAMRMSGIADRHGMRLYNVLVEQQPVSVEFIQERFRMAMEEFIGEKRQSAKVIDFRLRRLPYL